MEVHLVMFRDGGHSRPFHVTKDATVIGRREDCDLRIAVGDVSRKHCRLLKNGSSVSVEDLGSSNGTFVNGEKVQTRELSPGDTLQVGPVAFVIQIDGVPELGKARPAAKPPKPATASIDDELDEMEILNDSGGGSAAGDFDLDPAEK